MDAYEKTMKNLEGYVGRLKSELDNISEERLCPCKALEMDDNACDGCDKFSDLEEQTLKMNNEAAALNLESEKIRNQYYNALKNGLGEPK